MEPVIAWAIIAGVGVVVAVVIVVLIRRWDRQNARRYPDRVSSSKFEINREPREGKS